MNQTITKKTPISYYFKVGELKKFLADLGPDYIVKVRVHKGDRLSETDKYTLEVTWTEELS